MDIKDMKLTDVRERIAELKEFDYESATLEEIEANTLELREFNDREAAMIEAGKERRAEAERIANLPDDEVKIIKAFKPEEREMEQKDIETVENKELRMFANYIRGKVEERDGELNFDLSGNAAIVPTSIAQKVITKVKEMSPILRGATIYNVKGTLKVPVYGPDATGQDIAVGYQTEFVDITANAGKFASVDLSGHLAGALTLVGKSLANNADIDVVNFVVNEMAKKIALFIEKELINGTNDKASGALATATTMNAGSITAISADNLIDLQAKIPTAYQANACWTMNPATFTALKKLKDGSGNYLIQSDFSSAFPYRILGKPVYLSDNMPVIASAALAVLYGDYAGLSVNFRENISIEILREKYATQHAIGIVSWFEFDSKITDSQQLATLKMSVS